MTIGRPPFSASVPSTTVPPTTHSEWRMPLLKRQRPLSRKPPGSRTARPAGKKEIDAVGICPSANTTSRPACGRNAPSEAMPVVPTMVHQALVKSW